MTNPTALRNGTRLTAAATITESDISRCAELTGDFGAHHIAGIGGRPMAQGLLTAAITPLLRYGDGFHLQAMTLNFLAPVYTGDTITAAVTIDEASTSDGGSDVHLRITLTINNQDGTAVLTGSGHGFIGAGDDR